MGQGWSGGWKTCKYMEARDGKIWEKVSTEERKTVALTRQMKEGRKSKIKLNGKILKVVKSFNYLRSDITENGKITKEIWKWIQQASTRA